jgi:DNA-binding XRE family transcriptional regulator
MLITDTGSTKPTDRKGAFVETLPHLSRRNYLSVDVTTRFGERLRKLRMSRNMTQLQMSVCFGIDRSYISDVERGRKSVSLPTLEIIALGFNITLSELLDDV